MTWQVSLLVFGSAVVGILAGWIACRFLARKTAFRPSHTEETAQEILRDLLHQYEAESKIRKDGLRKRIADREAEVARRIDTEQPLSLDETKRIEDNLETLREDFLGIKPTRKQD